ncbi:MAG: phosphonate ABC transporter, permease protein PhnE, partial [Candidatus Bipolaricaulota bacterium]|nr:phosphonate ABC transporter, permease protein PhnE [Candidatus Bipolaricaulota bacterium]
ENFGISVGMKLLGLQISGGQGRLSERLGRRLLRFLLWNVLGLPLLGLIFADDQGRRALHDRLSGLSLVKAEPGRRTSRRRYTESWALAVLGIVTVTTVTAALFTKVDIRAFLTGAPKTGQIWAAILTPDWSVFLKGFRYLITTIFTAFLATAFAIVLAAPLSFLAARNLTHGIIGRIVYTVIRAVMSIIRSIEPIIWGIIFIVWVKVGAFPGVLALFVHSVADLTKLYSERLESIDPGPVEAIRATGANQLQVILYGIVPQIINPYLSFTIYRWDINVRMATVIGLIGVPVIGQLLYQYTLLYKFHMVGMMMLLILATVWAMDYMSARLRARLK